MSNNKQSSVVDWIFSQLPDEYTTTRSGFDVYQQAKAMHKEEIEASYADGYSEGYKRALELTQWTISNLVPPQNEKK